MERNPQTLETDVSAYNSCKDTSSTDQLRETGERKLGARERRV